MVSYAPYLLGRLPLKNKDQKSEKYGNDKETRWGSWEPEHRENIYVERDWLQVSHMWPVPILRWRKDGKGIVRATVWSLFAFNLWVEKVGVIRFVIRKVLSSCGLNMREPRRLRADTTHPVGIKYRAVLPLAWYLPQDIRPFLKFATSVIGNSLCPSLYESSPGLQRAWRGYPWPGYIVADLSWRNLPLGNYTSSLTGNKNYSNRLLSHHRAGFCAPFILRMHLP